MKKILLSFFLIIFCYKAQALEAIVIVLEAPLLRDASYDAQVLATLRKGKKIQIPTIAATSGELPEFIAVFDRAGNEAFIPSKYIKIIYNTDKEYETSVAYEGNDPTDYRIEEPISSKYPYDDSPDIRASVSVHIGSNSNSPFEYKTGYTSQKNKMEMGARVAALKKVDHDKFDRFYFGAIGFITSTKNSLNFVDGTFSEESRDSIRLGPYFIFDPYKTANYRLSVGTGFTFNYNKALLERENSNLIESRLFDGFSITPLVNVAYQVNQVFPHTDFIIGMDAHFMLPYNLKTKDDATNPILWSDNNQISSSFKVQASIFVGLQFRQ